MQSDYIVVGSGLTGATIARTLFDHGCDVTVLERRGQLGGNVHDHLHSCGVRIHTYGPHYFRTSSHKIWSYVNRFASFYPFCAELMTLVDGRLEHWPVTAEYIEREVGSFWKPASDTPGTFFEEASLALMPRLIYDNFVHGYTAKQWGVDPRLLEASLASRLEVRADGDRRLKKSRYQGIPTGGYARFMQRMLHGIRTYTNVDYLQRPQEFCAKKRLVFTGAIDEYFGFDYGRLAYRGQRRNHTYDPLVRWMQPVAQINYPDQNVPIIRSLEWKHMMEPELCESIKGTVITTETPYSPFDPGDFEYPFPDSRNRQLYNKYQQRVAQHKNVIVCGRLGEYRYLDMDQAIARAMMLAEGILRGSLDLNTLSL